MKKSLLLFVLALLPIMASAVEFTDANGIIYDLFGKGSTRVAKVMGTTETCQATKVLIIPATVNDGTDTYTVTTISSSGFIGNNPISWKKVRLPATITTIEDYACMTSSIATLDVEDLEAWCKITITSPNGSGWFEGNTSICPTQFCVNGTVVKDLVIPSSITTICKGLFRGFLCFDSVTIPGSVETIGDFAFSGCDMSSLTLGEGIKIIGHNAFENCSNLTTVTIPESCEYDNAWGCIFSNCQKLTSVIVNGNITTQMFSYCSNLTNVTIGTKCSQINGSAFMGTAITSIIIPSSVSYLYSGAFQGCPNLKTVTIKRDVDNMGMYNELYINGSSFADCPLIEDFYCEVPFSVIRTEDYGNPFENSYVNEATLHVPAADVTSYQTTFPWSQFGKVEAISGTTPPGPTPTKCNKPTISYNSATGTIDFACTTAGVEFVSSVTSEDVKNYSTASITLTQKFTISVYATKAGMDNSDTATMDIIITGNGQAIVVGDMDGNGTLNATDIVKLVNKIMGI